MVLRVEALVLASGSIALTSKVQASVWRIEALALRAEALVLASRPMALAISLEGPGLGLDG